VQSIDASTSKKSVISLGRKSRGYSSCLLRSFDSAAAAAAAAAELPSAAALLLDDLVRLRLAAGCAGAGDGVEAAAEAAASAWRASFSRWRHCLEMRGNEASCSSRSAAGSENHSGKPASLRVAPRTR